MIFDSKALLRNTARIGAPWYAYSEKSVPQLVLLIRQYLPHVTQMTHISHLSCPLK